MKRISGILSVIALTMSTVAAADVQTVVGKVIRVTASSDTYMTYNNSAKGLTFIHVEGLPNACNSNLKRVVIAEAHAAHSTAVAISLAALTSGKKVTLAYIDTCSQRNNAWDFAHITMESD